MLAGEQFGQIAFLLLGIAIAPDLIDAEVRVRAIRQADRSRSARNLLHGHAMGEIAEAGAAPFLFDRDAEKTKSAELRPQLAGKLVRTINLRGARGNLALGK